MSSAPKNSNDYDEGPESNTTDLELSDDELKGISAAGISMGNNLLEGLGNHADNEQAIQNMLSNGGDNPMSTEDMMRLQFELSQQHLQNEITTKAADKTSEGVQTLFKNQ